MCLNIDVIIVGVLPKMMNGQGKTQMYVLIAKRI